MTPATASAAAQPSNLPMTVGPPRQPKSTSMLPSWEEPQLGSSVWEPGPKNSKSRAQMRKVDAQIPDAKRYAYSIFIHGVHKNSGITQNCLIITYHILCRCHIMIIRIFDGGNVATKFEKE